MPSSDRVKPEAPFTSNDVRLSLGEWGIALAIIAAGFIFIPSLWERGEKLEAVADARQPFSLGNDYWLYGRLTRQACAEGKCLVVGDSVVWGHYVEADQTLSAQLNRLAGQPLFANRGLDGAHPAALLGLVDYFGRDIANQKVVLYCNLGWMGSKETDLQDRKKPVQNHPTLIPQFVPKIPAYNETLAAKLGIVMGRYVPMLAWAQHLEFAYFGGTDMPSWTMAHPCRNPLSPITLALPSLVEMSTPRPDTRPWTEAMPGQSDLPWVDFTTSLQWASFRQTIETLAARENKVFVVVGPLNEHKLTDKSRETYRNRLEEVKSWLVERNIPHHLAALLPSQEYADLSHPLADGYARLARQVYDDEKFKAFLTDR